MANKVNCFNECHKIVLGLGCEELISVAEYWRTLFNVQTASTCAALISQNINADIYA